MRWDDPIDTSEQNSNSLGSKKTPLQPAITKTSAKAWRLPRIRSCHHPVSGPQHIGNFGGHETPSAILSFPKYDLNVHIRFFLSLNRQDENAARLLDAHVHGMA